MNTSNILKISGIIVIVLVVLFALSLFELWTQLARYKNYWDRQNKQPVAAQSIQYIALGDSAAQGIGATHPTKGYVGVITNELEARNNKSVQTVNLSKSGAKIKDVLDTQLPAMKQRGVSDTDVVTVEIGANDMINYDAKKFRSEMDQLMKELPQQTVMTDIPYFGGSRFKSKQPDVEDANRTMYELAQKHNRQLAPLYEKTKNNGGPRTFAADWFHPSNYSYRENWAKVFLEQL